MTTFSPNALPMVGLGVSGPSSDLAGWTLDAEAVDWIPIMVTGIRVESTSVSATVGRRQKDENMLVPSSV